MLETVLQYGTGRAAALGAVRGGQDGHDLQLRRRLVRRLGLQVHGRGLGRLPQQARPDDHRLQRRARPRRHLPGADLARLHDLGAADRQEPRRKPRGPRGVGRQHHGQRDRSAANRSRRPRGHRAGDEHPGGRRAHRALPRHAAEHRPGAGPERLGRRLRRAQPRTRRREHARPRDTAADAGASGGGEPRDARPLRAAVERRQPCADGRGRPGG